MNTSLVYMLNGMYRDHVFVRGLVIFGSEILPYILVGLLAGWVILSKHKKKSVRDVTMILFSALLAVAISDFLKYWFESPRPFVTLDMVRGFIERDPYGSFPSSHMTFFTALAAASFRKHISLSGALFAGAFIIGLARIASGVHYPVDILGGFVLGLAIASLVGYAEKKYRDMYGGIGRKLFFWKD